ncbi:hypothetical protein BH11PLA2_BH11PLA2_25440 [soil metagenome]
MRFTYDLNGILEIEAVIVATKKVVSHVITKHAKGLSEANIRKAVRDMEQLKTHPRDEAANHYALTRAERVFKELPAELRHVLNTLIDGFEAGLESRDPEVIERHRSNLEEFLSVYDPWGENPTGNSDD